MAGLAGETIFLFEKVEKGVDPFNHPIFEYVKTPVENVLWNYSSADDVVTSTNMFGKKAIVTLAIPKGDNHSWIDVQVEIHGMKFKTFGYPVEGIESLVPGPWNKKVMCEVYG